MKLLTTVNLKFESSGDGTGFKVSTGYGGNYAVLKIGNVSLAFDDRNEWEAKEGYSGFNIERSELTDDPVSLHDKSVADLDGNSDPAYRLLVALASDLGYGLVKEGCNDED